ncbi:hypothetical protein HK096_008421 [Nowakowskiella sp. JEL0078]|nr:hypothetical protein HK096_008421 [Nowakowskiella sp. JEL0078]
MNVNSAATYQNSATMASTSTSSHPVVNFLPPSAYNALYGRDDIADRMKAMEALTEQTIAATSPYVLRLDGVAFHTFTKGLRAPFDDRFTTSMVETTKDLVSKLNPILAYCQSDEISLVFPAVMPVVNASTDSDPTDDSTSRKKSKTVDNDVDEDDGTTNHITKKTKRKKNNEDVERTHMYSGRVQKLASIAASYATARFNFHLAKKDWSDMPVKVQNRMQGHEAYFDGRVVICSDKNTVMECIFWRSNVDGLRNAISGIAQAYFSPKQLHQKSGVDKLKMLGEKGVDVFKMFSLRIVFGTWAKRELYEKFGSVDPRTGMTVEGSVTRSRTAVGSFNWADWSREERTEFVFAKYWPKQPGQPLMDTDIETNTEDIRY